MTNIQTISIALVGLGNVGRNVMQLLIDKEEHIRSRYSLSFKVVAASDSSGAAIAAPEARPAFGIPAKSEGLDLRELLRLKTAKQGVASLPKVGRPGMSTQDMVDRLEVGALLELSPTNLHDGEPGLSAVETAIARGAHVVLANKGPLVLAYPRLMEAAQKKRVRLAYSATVAGGLPTVNLGRRDLVVAQIDKIEGVLNGTTNFILTSMADHGMSYQAALAIAQANGIAETDPTLDVEGYDAAVKLLILAHAALDYHVTLADVERVGITGVSMEDLARAKAQGMVTKLLCVAERVAPGDAHSRAGDVRPPAGERIAPGDAHSTPGNAHPRSPASLSSGALARERGAGGQVAGDVRPPAGERDGVRYKLSVKPTALPPTHPMARLTAGQMGITYHTDVNGEITAVIEEGNPMPTAAAVVRDLINLYWQA